MKRFILILAIAWLLPLTAAVAAPAQLTPFQATYKVLRKGDVLGTSTLKLAHNADGTWTYTSELKAEHGVAAALGGHIKESSRFRTDADGAAEALAYDYRMHVVFKTEERHMRVDWDADRVTVKDGDGTYHYAAKPGLLERHLKILALGRRVADGDTQAELAVGGKHGVDEQTYAIRDAPDIEVPLGHFDGKRVDRTHDDKGFRVWFASDRFGTAPVKLFQASGGNITLLLKHFESDATDTAATADTDTDAAG